MLLGIFDVFHITEFNGKITNWGEVLITILGTGVVTWLAAFIQIKSQKCSEEKTQRNEDEKDKTYLKYLIESTINEFNKNKRMITQSFVEVNLVENEVAVIYYKVSCRFPLKFKEYNSSRMFYLLLPGQQKKEHIKLFTEFLEAIEIGVQIIDLFSESQNKHDIQQKEITEKINDLFQGFIVVIRGPRIHNNIKSIFREGAELELQINSIISEKYKGEFFKIYKICSHIIKYTIENNKSSYVDFEIIHKYIIPISQEFEKLKKSNAVFNRDIRARIEEIEKVLKIIESFNNFLNNKVSLPLKNKALFCSNQN